MRIPACWLYRARLNCTVPTSCCRKTVVRGWLRSTRVLVWLLRPASPPLCAGTCWRIRWEVMLTFCSFFRFSVRYYLNGLIVINVATSAPVVIYWAEKVCRNLLEQWVKLVIVSTDTCSKAVEVMAAINVRSFPLPDIIMERWPNRVDWNRFLTCISSEQNSSGRSS